MASARDDDAPMRRVMVVGWPSIPAGAGIAQFGTHLRATRLLDNGEAETFLAAHGAP